MFVCPINISDPPSKDTLRKRPLTSTRTGRRGVTIPKNNRKQQRVPLPSLRQFAGASRPETFKNPVIESYRRAAASPRGTAKYSRPTHRQDILNLLDGLLADLFDGVVDI